MGSASQSTRSEDGEMVEVGRVLRPHALQGEVLVIADSENPARFESGSELFFRAGDRVRRLEVLSSRPHRGRRLVRFVGVADRDGAEALRGVLLEVPQERVPVAEEGTFYYFQLVGCEVVDKQLGDLGEVTEVVEDGGGVLLSVSAAVGGRTVLIPFANRLLPEINVEERLIRSDLPDGLLETCGSTS